MHPCMHSSCEALVQYRLGELREDITDQAQQEWLQLALQHLKAGADESAKLPRKVRKHRLATQEFLCGFGNMLRGLYSRFEQVHACPLPDPRGPPPSEGWRALAPSASSRGPRLGDGSGT